MDKKEISEMYDASVAIGGKYVFVFLGNVCNVVCNLCNVCFVNVCVFCFMFLCKMYKLITQVLKLHWNSNIYSI